MTFNKVTSMTREQALTAERDALKARVGELTVERDEAAASDAAANEECINLASELEACRQDLSDMHERFLTADTALRDAGLAKMEAQQHLSTAAKANEDLQLELRGTKDIAAVLIQTAERQTAEAIADFVGTTMDNEPPGDWRLLPRRIRAQEWKP